MGATMRQIIYDKLKEIAHVEGLITYQDVGDLVGLDMHDPGDRVAIAQLLDDINREEVTEHHRPMLSAVVVRKEDSIPGQGFFKCAENLGRCSVGADETFYFEELRRVYDAWH